MVFITRLFSYVVLVALVLLSVKSDASPRKGSKRVCLLSELKNGYYVDSDGELITGRRVKLGKVAEARCNIGFRISGNVNRRCSYRTRDFDEDAPLCQDINECRYISVGTTSYSDDSSVESQVGSSLSEIQPFTSLFSMPLIQCHDMAYCVNTPGSFECECDSGYEGDGVQSCQKVIEKTCGPLEPPEYGTLIGDQRHVRFECEDGYRIYGARSRKCVDGVWNGLHPVCEVIGCGKPRAPTNGFIEGSKFDVGNWVIFRCNEGYELAGHRRRDCKPGDGYRYGAYWSGSQPFCRSSAKDPNSIASKIKTDFIDHLEVFAVSGRGRLAVSDNVGLELVFAFDTSASINHVNFERGINFTESLLKQFGISYDKGGTRVAVISFADTADIEFSYGSDVDTLDEVMERINSMKGNRGGGTALGDAMLRVFDLTDDMRNGSKRALFILTDGEATITGEDPSANAESLRLDERFEIFVVAIGEWINQRQLRKIASQPYSTHIFLLKNFEDLASLTEIISEKGQEYRRCGQAGNLELPKLGETNANPDAWPWLTQVIKHSDDVTVLQCGGALLCEDWVITAGSCVFDNKTFSIAPEKLRVRLGAYEFGVHEDTQQEFDVTQVILNDDFGPFNRHHDIALLKLNQTVNLTSSVRTLCLSSDIAAFWLKSNSLCYIAGWGIIDPVEDQPKNDSTPSTFQKQLEVPLVNDAVCEKTMSHPFPFTERKMCAGFRYDEDEACRGDTGAPLVCQQIDGAWALAGVASYSNECVKSNKYGVFTRVSQYTNWIHAITGNCTSEYLADLTVGGFT